MSGVVDFASRAADDVGGVAERGAAVGEGPAGGVPVVFKFALQVPAVALIFQVEYHFNSGLPFFHCSGSQMWAGRAPVGAESLAATGATGMVSQ